MRDLTWPMSETIVTGRGWTAGGRTPSWLPWGISSCSDAFEQARPLRERLAFLLRWWSRVGLSCGCDWRLVERRNRVKACSMVCLDEVASPEASEEMARLILAAAAGWEGRRRGEVGARRWSCGSSMLHPLPCVIGGQYTSAASSAVAECSTSRSHRAVLIKRACWEPKAREVTGPYGGEVTVVSWRERCLSVWASDLSGPTGRHLAQH